MSYASIVIEGGIFPADLLDRLANADLAGQAATDFGLDGRRMVSELQAAFSAARTYWEGFHERRLRSRESLTTLTRQAWMEPVFELLGFQLERQRAGLPAGGESFVISHTAGDGEFAPPVHIVEYERSLDSRDGRRSPHSAVQEYLNRSDALWGIVTNGVKVRLLRDSSRISHPVYLEFDLQAMVDNNLYSEFVVFFRLLHATRFPKEGAGASSCLLEQYYELGIAEGGRVREHLRDGVEDALVRLGTAFLSHPRNVELRAAFESGRLDESRYYRELLRLIYRLLFLAVAEERKLVFPGGSDPAKQAIYDRYYSLSALRNRADGGRGRDGHTDLWQGLVQAFRLFRDDGLAMKLGVHALNGELFGEQACEHIEGAECTNRDLLEAVHALSMFRDEQGRVWRRVNYASLDVEELGSVYESLLDFHPLVVREPWSFQLISGSERKTTGSYYTPPELVQELIRSALVPVVEERLKACRTNGEKERALLGLRVIDPASGSGHFVLAAARRIARELGKVRSGEDEPSPAEYRRALRDVIRSCVYAVDRNPLAADLCKVALWIEGHNAGLPLSFLDNHVKCGDSLVGVFDLDVLRTGIPDEAYTAVSGDEKPIATALKKRNKAEREGQLSLGMDPGLPERDLADDFEAFASMEERTPADVHAKEEIYEQIRGSGSKWYRWKVACDLWTAAFFTPLTAASEPLVPTTSTVKAHLQNPKASHGLVVGNAAQVSGDNRFFHWPLEFPEVFAKGGFDVVLGNPPWEQIQMEESAWFRFMGAPDIADLPGERRKAAIRQLSRSRPTLAGAWNAHCFEIEAQARFVRQSNRFTLTAVGKLNTYALFAEFTRSLISAVGNGGIIVQSDIATSDTNRFFFGDLLARNQLVSFFDFVNTHGIFPGIHRTHPHFCLLTITKTGFEQPTFSFWNTRGEQLSDSSRKFVLAPDDFALLNPNTRTCPIFRTARDAEITKAIYRRVPVLIAEGPPEVNPWGVSFSQGLFNMTSASGLFAMHDDLEDEGYQLDGNVFVKGGERWLPLYEAKMVHQFDHRWASYEDPDDAGAGSDHQKADPKYVVQPRYWVDEREVEAKLRGRWDRGWLLGWRDITNTTNERTVIAGVIPRVGVGNKFPLMLINERDQLLAPALIADLSSFALDFASRQKLGGTTLNFFIYKQLPVLGPDTFRQQCPWEVGRRTGDWIAARVLELTYTAWDLQPFARDLGYDGPPFRWDPERRFLLRCELDAAFFHLYGVSRDDVDYIMDTFPIVRRKDEAAHGEYRTKRVILEIYDELARAAASGVPYRSRLVPGPGERAAHE